MPDFSMCQAEQAACFLDLGCLTEFVADFTTCTNLIQAFIDTSVLNMDSLQAYIDCGTTAAISNQNLNSLVQCLQEYISSAQTTAPVVIAPTLAPNRPTDTTTYQCLGVAMSCFTDLTCSTDFDQVSTNCAWENVVSSTQAFMNCITAFFSWGASLPADLSDLEDCLVLNPNDFIPDMMCHEELEACQGDTGLNGCLADLTGIAVACPLVDYADQIERYWTCLTGYADQYLTNSAFSNWMKCFQGEMFPAAEDSNGCLHGIYQDCLDADTARAEGFTTTTGSPGQANTRESDDSSSDHSAVVLLGIIIPCLCCCCLAAVVACVYISTSKQQQVISANNPTYSEPAPSYEEQKFSAAVPTARAGAVQAIPRRAEGMCSMPVTSDNGTVVVPTDMRAP